MGNAFSMEYLHYNQIFTDTHPGFQISGRVLTHLIRCRYINHTIDGRIQFLRIFTWNEMENCKKISQKRSNCGGNAMNQMSVLLNRMWKIECG